MDCSPPGSSVHGLLQAILQAILECAAIVYWALGKVPWPQVLIPDNTFEHCHFSGHKWNRTSLRTSIKHTERLGMWTELCIWSCTSLILLKPQPVAQIRFRNAVPGFLGNEVSLSHQQLPCLPSFQAGAPPGGTELVLLRAEGSVKWPLCSGCSPPNP